MTVARAQMLATPLACPVCGGAVDVKSPHVTVTGGAVRVYCSANCLRVREAPPPAPPPVAIAAEPPPRRVWWWLAGGLVAGTASVALATTQLREPAVEADVPPAAVVFAPEPPPPPRAPPPDPERAADAALLAELAQDAWLHPLAGPQRRMPVNHNGAFGAARPGERPPECVSGHCGVDLGNVWGEPVHAVHAGVVDFVHRGPNEERGGIFVKIAHRGGTLFTWYFHLAAVPRAIRPGVAVRAGQVIGLLGDTGIKHSAPHLHFAISVKPSKASRERYLDPEPLIAIWPLWIPDADQRGGRLSTAPEPGLPVRAPARRKPKKRRAANDNVTTEAAPAVADDATAEGPAPIPVPAPTGAAR